METITATKTTLVLGASPNPSRYSNMAVKRLRQHGHEVIAFGRRDGMISDVQIYTDLPDSLEVHTISLYMNPALQKDFYDFILAVNPKRIIFNPGTENPELEALAAKQNIETLEACTLVMLSNGLF